MKQHPKGRTLAEFKPLTPAEVLLLEACKSGLPANLGDSRPCAEPHAYTVRADFLRFFCWHWEGATMPPSTSAAFN